MMKNLLMISVFALSANTLLAQNDTLLHENFTVDPTANWVMFNSGNDTQWVNFDADGLPDANAAAGREQFWWWSEGAFATVDSAQACVFSSSWLDGFLPGNRNWLMTPPIQIIDANATLSWTSAPRQTPLYLDGYTVLVSTTDNLEASFTDTLFQAGQYLSNNDPNATGDYSLYTFSPGFIHGEDGTYVEFDPASDSTSFVGELRPFSASLAAYSGQTIYIAFLHDSDDDNLMALDDILVMGTATGLSENTLTQGLSVYPNPAADKLELSYTLAAPSPVSVEVFDLKGSKVISNAVAVQLAGAQKFTVNVSDLAAGTYNVVLSASGKSVSTKFVKD